MTAHADDPGARQNDGAQGRLFVIVLDDLHTPSLRTPQVRRAARLFIEEHMGANDLAAVVTTSGRSNASQDLTGDKQLLLRAVDGFLGQRLWRSDELLDAERGFNARIAMSSLRDVAGRMGELNGRRKALLFISEGIDYDIYDVFEARDATIVRDEVRSAISAATRSNVSIYSVDPRGLTSLADEDIEQGESSRFDRAWVIQRTTAPCPGQSPNSLGHDRRLRSREFERLRGNLRPDRPRQQHLLPAGLQSGECQARRPLQED